MFLVGLLASYIVSYWITNPILRLSAASKSLSSGAWDQAVSIERSDEIGELAESFNSMAHQLRKSFETLEQRVAERTAELAHHPQREKLRPLSPAG